VKARQRLLVRARSRGLGAVASEGTVGVALDELANVIVVGAVAGEHVGHVRRVTARSAGVDRPQHVVSQQPGFVGGPGSLAGRPRRCG